MSTTRSNVPLAAIRRSYEQALVERAGTRAARAITLALQEGAHPLQIYDEVIIPSQVAIGDRWHEGEIGVAEEHVATQLSIEQINRLRQLIHPKPPLNKKVVVGALSGDAHWLGARVVADHFLYDGWNVDFLGASPPITDLLSYLDKARPDLLLLSVTLVEELDTVSRIVEKLGKKKDAPKVLVGGRAFQMSGQSKPSIQGVTIVSNPHEATKLGRKLCGILDSEAALEQLLRLVGQRVQARRKERGLSQRQVAEAAGLDRAYLSSIESGKQNLSLGVLVKIAAELDLVLHELLRDDERS